MYYVTNIKKEYWIVGIHCILFWGHYQYLFIRNYLQISSILTTITLFLFIAISLLSWAGLFLWTHFPFGTIGVFAAKIRSLQKLVAYRRRELRIRKWKIAKPTKICLPVAIWRWSCIQPALRRNSIFSSRFQEEK